MKKIGSSIVVAASTFLPMIALAQSFDNGQDRFGGITDFLYSINDFISNVLIPLVFAVALLVFMYGIFRYFILGGGDENSREEGKKLMLYSIVGFVLMVSIFGIVNLISSGLGFSGGSNEFIQGIPDTPKSNL